MSTLLLQHKYIKQIKYSLLLISMLVVSSCGMSNEESTSENSSGSATNSEAFVEASQNTEEKTEKHMILTGTLLYQQMEGGFYGFVADNGQKYMLSGLNNEFRKNGIVLEVEVSEIEGLMTIQQFGKSMKVHNVKVIDASKVKSINDIM